MLKQTFNDGMVKIYQVENVSEEGGMPTDKLVFKESLRYKERIVGIDRFWKGQQGNAQIDRLLRVQVRRNISSQDVAIPNDDEQYLIKQIQYIENSEVMDLSLERIDAKYDIK